MTEHTRKIESVFCADDDWQANACLNWSNDPIDLYAIGYKAAGDKIVEFVLMNSREQDILIYPIVFLYRQYIELRLKEIIKEGSLLLEEGNNFPTHHKIWDLWCIAKQIAFKAFEHGDDLPNMQHTEHVIKEFSQIDPDSCSFRYPTTKKGEKSLDGVTHINIRRLAIHIEELSRDIEGISNGISIYRDWKQEMWNSM